MLCNKLFKNLFLQTRKIFFPSGPPPQKKNMQKKGCRSFQIYLLLFIFQSTFSVRIEDDDLYTSAVRADLKGPDSNPPVTFSWSGRVGTASFTPLETGIHRVKLFTQDLGLQILLCKCRIVDCKIGWSSARQLLK